MLGNVAVNRACPTSTSGRHDFSLGIQSLRYRKCIQMQQPHAHRHVRAGGAVMGRATIKEPQSTFNEIDMEAKMAYLREDLKHLFDDKGIDPSAYEDVVDFRDPITRYSSLSGYLFNIKFLRAAFDPRFTLHDMRTTVYGPASEPAIVTRWTMDMRFRPAGSLPTRKFWNPRITFTGTSTYVFNPQTGKIFRHIDTWDSIKKQEFFSFEGFLDFLRQLFSTWTAPALETANYTVLRRTRDYEVRRYDPFVVAETEMEAAEKANREALKGGQVAVNPDGPGTRAFNALARYIFGGNSASARMAMTTPVFSDTAGTMRFVIGASSVKALPNLPAPISPDVRVSRQEGGLFAVRVFGGAVRERDSARQVEELRRSLSRDGLKAAGPDWTLARYNDPRTLPPFRRNEVLVPLGDFDLWM